MYKITIFLEDSGKDPFIKDLGDFRQSVENLGYKIARMTGEPSYEENKI